MDDQPQSNPPTDSPAGPAASPVATPDANRQRQGLLDAQRAAHRTQPRSFKDDALTDKIVSVEPDGTGPTPTETFDTDEDRRREHADR